MENNNRELLIKPTPECPENKLAKVFGEKIFQLRKTLNLTQKEFADEIETSQTMVYLWEKGEALISTKYLNKICTQYRLSMSYWDDDIPLQNETLTKREFNDALFKILNKLQSLERRLPQETRC